MSALDKIIEGIMEQAELKAGGILAEAGAAAAEILKRGESERAEQGARLGEVSERECREVADRARSADRQVRRHALLEARNRAIDEVISEARARIANMPDGEYFDLLFRLYEKNAQPFDGVMRFDPADFARLPDGFLERCRQVSPGFALEASEGSHGIGRGFVIQYGDIFQNCSFDSIFEAEEQNLRDMVYAVLTQKAV